MPINLSTLDRAAINRLNSQKSTGPRTEAGKRASSLNALRHCITAQTLVLPSEELKEYLSFTQKYQDEFAPKGNIETQTVQSMASTQWRLNRLEAIENSIFALDIHRAANTLITERQETHTVFAMALSLRDRTKALSTLSMHQQRLTRQLAASLRELRNMQAERHDRERSDMREAVLLLKLHLEEQQQAAKLDPAAPPKPFEICATGCVYTVPEIELHIYRQERLDKAYAAERARSAGAQ